MKILVTGRNGQVGYQLERSLQGLGEVVAVGREQMDLTNLDQVRDVVRAVKPQLIVNAAAYTAVDKAESEPELAMRVNGEAPGVMAAEARRLGAAMIHYSTDYVFDGAKGAPYVEDDDTCPLSAYGRSKLAGEQAIRSSDIPFLILRTSWVYGLYGKNFLTTIMRLAQERDELRIVNDQHGAPTWTRTVADTTAHIVANITAGAAGRDAGAFDAEAWRRKSGLYHLAAQGRTTWYEFTRAIVAHPSVPRKPAVLPIPTSEFPTPARRPPYSVLDCGRLSAAFCALPDWKTGLSLCQAGAGGVP
jgi:dTDP-4-dehydrorhamnose reductase